MRLRLVIHNNTHKGERKTEYMFPLAWNQTRESDEKQKQIHLTI